jgi:hypothetical protein
MWGLASPDTNRSPSPWTKLPIMYMRLPVTGSAVNKTPERSAWTKGCTTTAIS